MEKIIALAVLIAVVSTLSTEWAYGEQVNMTLVEESTDEILNIVNGMFDLSLEKDLEYQNIVAGGTG